MPDTDQEQMPPMPQDENPQMADMGGEAVEQGDESMFDTNFDPGVEADKDEDPKHYAQQVTGCLSQHLNKMNNNGELTPEDAKYVGKMIIKQVSKALDDEAKKDLIRTINTTEGKESEEDEMPVTDNEEEMGGETFGDEAMNETVYTKSQMKKLKEEFNQHIESDEKTMDLNKTENQKLSKKTPFSPKKFN